MAALEDRWQEAALGYFDDASVGRLFRGLLHNLNGIGQAFAMQAELLEMTFAEADRRLGEAAAAGDMAENRRILSGLQLMLAKRAGLVAHQVKQSAALQGLLKRAAGTLGGLGESGVAQAVPVAEIISMELAFQAGDPFFKHNIEKVVELDEQLPSIRDNRLAFHQLLGIMLENAAQSLILGTHPEGSAPRIKLRGAVVDAGLLIEVQDNGPGVVDDLETLSAPFYYTPEKQMGLGLFFARQICSALSGSLNMVSRPGGTVFSFCLPVGSRGGNEG